ncbi:MAG TPA: COX15/CtaA family protein [Mycobacteriales bacterium]|nr:COX15/CtaA family protein [Mycobacteriales bacterium]
MSPTAFRRLALVTTLVLAAIVVTGGAVRLTNSGLGCPTWPRCTATSYVAPTSYHALVEFVNRMITVGVSVLVGVTFLGAVLRRPRRVDLTLGAGGLVLGVAGQAVIGGLSVIYKLSPGWVMAHFLVSMLVVWNAIVLYRRADPDWAPGLPLLVRPELVWLGRLLAATAGLVLVLGTFVTGAGPHSGAPHAARLHLPLERVTQLHADAALFLTGLVVATAFALRIAGAPAHVRRRAHWLLGLLGVQVAVGYAQYFLDLPPGLIIVHIACATALWLAVLWLNLGFTTPVAVEPVGARAVRNPGAGVPREARAR